MTFQRQLLLHMICIIPGWLAAQSTSTNHYTPEDTGIYQIKALTEGLIPGIYGKEMEKARLAIYLGIVIDSTGAIKHYCIDAHSQFYEWEIKDSLLQIDWQDTTEKYLVFRYEQYLFLVPLLSKQAFLKEFLSVKKRKLDFDKKLDKNKPYPRIEAFWILATQYWVKELQ